MNDEEEHYIETMIRHGHSNREVAWDLGISEGAIRKRLKKWGIKRDGTHFSEWKHKVESSEKRESTQ